MEIFGWLNYDQHSEERSQAKKRLDNFYHMPRHLQTSNIRYGNTGSVHLMSYIKGTNTIIFFER